MSLPKRAWRRVAWREGTNATLASRFAAVRVRPAPRDYNRPTPRPEEWLLIEWPSGEREPTKYWLSTLPANIARRPLVDLVKLRWRIERDYQVLKQELGLGHYEGRGWPLRAFTRASSSTIPPSLCPCGESRRPEQFRY